MKGIINIKDLAVGYKSIPVVKHINFELTKGELCAIVGVNGIGKSTLLRTLGKLQPKIDGHIKLHGEPIESFSFSELAKKMALVLTESIATKNLTVSELIALGRQPYTNWLGTLSDNDQQHITNSFEIFQLLDLKEKKCYELSDGQLQRVLIARAMAQDTPIILLDEPTTHLDLSHKVEIMKLMQKLAHNHQKTILFTTHEIDLAIQLCDKILILDEQNNAFGKPNELIKNGSFNTIFPSQIVRFDPASGSFKVNK